MISYLILNSRLSTNQHAHEMFFKKVMISINYSIFLYKNGQTIVTGLLHMNLFLNISRSLILCTRTLFIMLYVGFEHLILGGI